MTPVQTVTIRQHLSDDTLSKHDKPVYRCEVCLEPASFGFKEGKKRKWFCKSHLPKERNVA